MVSKAGGSGPCVGLARPGSLIPTASSRFRHQRGGAVLWVPAPLWARLGVSSVRVCSHGTFSNTHSEPGVAYQVASLLNKHLLKSVPAAEQGPLPRSLGSPHPPPPLFSHSSPRL